MIVKLDLLMIYILSPLALALHKEHALNREPHLTVLSLMVLQDSFDEFSEFQKALYVTDRDFGKTFEACQAHHGLWICSFFNMPFCFKVLNYMFLFLHFILKFWMFILGVAGHFGVATTM